MLNQDEEGKATVYKLDKKDGAEKSRKKKDKPEGQLAKTLTFGLGKAYGYDNKKTKAITPLSEDDRKAVYAALRQCSRDFGRICNYTVSLFYAARILKSDGQKLEDTLQELGYNKGYKPILEKMGLETPLAGASINQVYALVRAHFAGDHGKSLLGKGDRALPSHKTDGTHPIYFHKENSSLLVREKKYYITYNIFSEDWAKDNSLPNWIAFEIKPQKCDKTGLQQIQKIIDGEWEKGNSQLARSRRKDGRKWLMRVVAKYVPDPYKTLDPSITMGVDLGVTCPAVLHIRQNGTEGLGWQMAVGRGKELLDARRTVSNEIKRIMRALKGKNSPLTGANRKAAQEKLRELRQREKRILKTATQKMAATIADIARREGAGYWQLEDLWRSGEANGGKKKLKKKKKEELPEGVESEDYQGSVKDGKPWLARNWAPAMLKEALKWQAVQRGATLELVNPRKTSQRCSKCGHIARENRPKGKKKAAFFECVSCGYKLHADKNAARNLSIIGIADIIKEKEASMANDLSPLKGQEGSQMSLPLEAMSRAT